jgi:HAD superfamily hydrolase (TIGR01490 family)
METIFSKDSNKKYIAFFDLDHTITNAVSGNVLTKAALKKGLMSKAALIHAVYLSFVYKLNLKDPLKIIDSMVEWVAGIPEQTINDLSAEVFKDILLPFIHSEVISEINTHKEKNAAIVMLSSAIRPVCYEMAKYLDMDDIICSDLEVRNGYLTGRPMGHICFGNEKAVRLKNYCEKNNTDLSDAWYYGDSFSDYAALNSVGNPVCINPDRKLKRAANKMGWKILHWS